METKNDLKCPNCNIVLDFKNIFGYDNEKMDVLGLLYFIKCLNCGHLFLTDMRFQRKLSEKEAEEMIEKLKEKIAK